METITKSFNIYKFHELSKDSQEKAISDHINFEIEIAGNQAFNPYQDSFDEAERLQTPWFLGQIVYENHKNDIIETIRINEYGFFENGELIPRDYYPENWHY